MITPAGRLLGTDAGADLVLVRRFRAPIEDVWAGLTESERTARWFGPWKGEAGAGHDIEVQMVFEEEQPWMTMSIGACEPPRHLAISSVDEHGSWFLEVELSEADGSTELRFVQHFTASEIPETVSHTGPGWEYYLDLFVAAREGTAAPDFGDYYPAMRDYYENLRPE